MAAVVLVTGREEVTQGHGWPLIINSYTRTRGVIVLSCAAPMAASRSALSWPVQLAPHRTGVPFAVWLAVLLLIAASCATVMYTPQVAQLSHAAICVAAAVLSLRYGSPGLALCIVPVPATPAV